MDSGPSRGSRSGPKVGSNRGPKGGKGNRPVLKKFGMGKGKDLGRDMSKAVWAPEIFSEDGA